MLEKPVTACSEFKKINHNYTTLKPTGLDTPAKELLEIEQRYLAFYSQLNDYLSKHLHPNTSVKPNQTESSTWLAIKKFLYYLLYIVSFIQSAIGSFLFAQSLLTALCIFSPIAVLVGSIVIALINCLLFYAFDTSISKKSLGIILDNKQCSSMLHIYIKQVKALKAINTSVFNIHLINKLSFDDYQSLTSIVIALNKDIEKKHQQLTSYKESMAKKIIRYASIGFQGFLIAAGAYFMATSLLSLVAAPLLFTPFGFVLVGLMMAAALSLYIATQGNNIKAILNPDQKLLEKLTCKLNHFKFKSEVNFLTEKKVIQEKSIDDETGAVTVSQYGLKFHPTVHKNCKFAEFNEKNCRLTI